MNVYLEKFYWNDSGCEKNLAYTRQDKTKKLNHQEKHWNENRQMATILLLLGL